MITELRMALRAMRARPGFFLTAILTLTLGIGAVTAIFTVYDAVLLKPLPFAHAERIVTLSREQGSSVQRTASVPVFDEWRERGSAAFTALGAYAPETMNLAGAGAEDAQRLAVHKVTPGFWQVFSQPLALGTSWGEQEESHNEHVVVLSDALWRSRFGADAGVLGRDIRLNGDAYRIVGVARPEFRFPERSDVWIPTFTPGHAQSRRTVNFLRVVGLLRENAGPAQAASAIQGVIDWQVRNFPQDETAMQARVVPLQEQIGAPVGSALDMLLAAAGLVLLIACANLANLMLARGQNRAQELALRSALGAGRLVRHALAESLLIALAGTCAGLAVAKPAIAGLVALAPDLLPAYNLPTIDLRVVAGTSAVALLTLFLFALYPALRAAATDPVKAMQGSSRSQTGSVRQMRARSILVSAEVALALTLLAGAGLLIGTLQQLDRVDSGVRTDHVLTAQFSISTLTLQPGQDLNTWAETAISQLTPRLDAIEKRLRELPGVETVSLSFGLPASGNASWSSSFQVVGAPEEKHAEVQYRFVSEDYFRTFGIPVEAGRAFNALDGRRALMPTELLVNRAFADRYLAGRDPLTSEIKTFGDAPIPVIGVVGNVRQAGLDHDINPEVYFPISKAIQGDLSIALKVQGDAMAQVEPLRRAMREVAADAPVYEIRPMDAVIGETLGLRRFNTTLMSLFAAVAVALAAVGLYGVIAYSVGQRRREIGLRQALGAGTLSVHRLILGSSLRMILPGIGVGLLGALALGRLISAQLYGVRAADPLVLALVVAVLGAASLLACLIPSIQAARMSPMDALRDE